MNIDINNKQFERLDILLKHFEQRQISIEEAQELKLLLEPLYRTNLDEGDINESICIAS